jgi:hypothetical protein
VFLFDYVVKLYKIVLYTGKFMKENSKKIGSFLALGIIAVGALVAAKDPNVHRYIDNKLYQYGKNTFFQPIEDYRFNVLINYVAKHSSLNDVVSFDNIAEYKESLKDSEVFEGELAAMHAYVEDNQAKHESIKQSDQQSVNSDESKAGQMYRGIPSDSKESKPFHGNEVIGKIYKIRDGVEQLEIPPSPKSKFI